MPLRNSSHAYGVIARVLHWSSVALVLALYIGISGVDLPPKNLARDAVIGFHAALGLVLLGVMLVRLAWRAVNPNPVCSFALTRRHRRVVFAVHRTLYALVLSLCALGLAALGSGQVRLELFDLGAVTMTLPSAPGWCEVARALHDGGARVLLVLILVHATTAVVNQIVGIVAPPASRP